MTIDIPRQTYLGSVLTKTIGTGATRLYDRRRHGLSVLPV